MLNVFIRTVLIYLILTVVMRIMGKRQLGELDVGELVITILLSEIASLPITNPEKSIFDALIPIAILVSLEVLSSTLILKYPFAKRLLSSKPSVIIAHGKLDRKAMKRVRISIEELISQIRQNGIFDLEEVDYAILEENGKMSIIPKSQYRQPDKTDLQLPYTDSGMMHILISDGIINNHSLSLLKKNRVWLDKQLKPFGLTYRDIFCMTCNDAGNIYIIKNDGTTVQTGSPHE
ncbi:MAG: DUF421 domain-containing protein [Clostridia bacterium]|nr:DUF421 domain-containing protein [Clostridia bacterium]